MMIYRYPKSVTISSPISQYDTISIYCPALLWSIKRNISETEGWISFKTSEDICFPLEDDRLQCRGFLLILMIVWALSKPPSSCQVICFFAKMPNHSCLLLVPKLNLLISKTKILDIFYLLNALLPLLSFFALWSFVIDAEFHLFVICFFPSVLNVCFSYLSFQFIFFCFPVPVFCPSFSSVRLPTFLVPSWFIH